MVVLHFRRRMHACLCCLFVLAMGSSPVAQSDRVDLYLGVHAVHSTVGGDFDGQRMILSSDELFFVPEFKPSVGYGVTLGVANVMSSVELDAEISGHRTTHQTSFAGYTFQKTTFDEIAGDFKIKYAKGVLQPFLLAGAGTARIVVKDGSMNANEWVADDDYTTFSFRIGVGGDLAVDRHLYLSTSAMYRISNFRYVSGWYRTKILGGLNGNGISLSAALHLRFTLANLGR